jgi:Cu(I)/Ag(I) efflux system membrane protein CusA/SilA
MPIQNRVDMLATGVNTTVGVRVLGPNLDDVVHTSDEIAAAIKRLPGAAQVVADPIRGKCYLEVRVDRERCAAVGVPPADASDLIQASLGGRVVSAFGDRNGTPIRLRVAHQARSDEDAIRNLPLSVGGRLTPLSAVADVRVVEGPAAVRSENGRLRNYVRFNARNCGSLELVEAAKRAVADNVKLPPGVTLEWTGQYEHEIRARSTLVVVVPLVLALIFGVLYLTFHDVGDALLMILAIPGALAGGVFFQWLFSYRFSVTVWIGIIACFGMATSTAVIMLTYLRESLSRAGPIEQLSLGELRSAVLDGAVLRLRPKLLTEAAMLLGLAPMFWATGVGSEVVRPMAAPVLGGILVADEVVDLFIPVAFYWSRRWRRRQALADKERTDAAA